MKGFCFEKSGALCNRPELAVQSRAGVAVVIYAGIFLWAMLRFTIPSFPPHQELRVAGVFLFIGLILALGLFLINGMVFVTINKKDGAVLQKWGAWVTFWKLVTPLAKVKSVLIEKYIWKRKTMYDLLLRVEGADPIKLLVMRTDFQKTLVSARTVADYLGLQVEVKSRGSEAEGAIN